ncbi:hypothetical protein NHH03_21075 [Stieleria sp. TO1_6]|uniref:hypothetical protein n=1 Tax=Stieleria tagensis TaxID=2956795 RepID=UPI00209B45CB|nr:hypothetical protein [Stieleria tagensis]MCO8124249.1 hypothetical protein [Stieleria tagensis]
MGFLKRILRNTPSEDTGSVFTPGSFEALTEDELQTHMGINSYGAFELTDAIRPSYDLQVIPRQGFRFDEYVDDSSQARTPVIMAATTRHRVMDLLLDLIDNLGPVVDVVLETSHHASSHQLDLYREHIDVPVLKSILLDHEDLLLNDGCTGIAVINPERRQEVQLDEHKLLVIYGRPLEQFEQTLIMSDVYPDESIKFITEAEHVHSSSEAYFDKFNALKHRLGMDSDDLSGCC